MIEVTKEILKSVYQPRPTDKAVRKYDYGLLLIIGGSDFYSGQPAISALAAFKAGVDVIRVIAPKRAADIIASFFPAISAYPLDGSWLEKRHLATLLSMAESAKEVSRGKTALVIGGGMGRTKETQEAIIEFLTQNTLPAVIDADAIYALAKSPQSIKGENSVITPNTYEFYALTGREIYQLPDEEKVKIVQEEAEKLQTTIVLKGKLDIISNGKEVAINRTGSPYLSKMGIGDAFAGICGAFLAKGIDSFTAAQAAAYINGLAGEIAAKKMKDSLLVTDLIEAIPKVIK
ncbi:MAG: NAD(P)H-hydrate dehydratase [bacterium]|nr:NAD(P)H-hydrate dehydratase [bacterium]